jgi:signal transduction histidine kinase
MRRGAKPAKARVEAKQSLSGKSPKNEGSRVRDLEQRLAEALKRETEALDRQTATSEVLKVISRSTFDLQPVLETLIESAVRLCGANSGLVYRQDGDLYRVVVACGTTPAFVELAKKYPMGLNRQSATGRAILDRRVVHIPDFALDPEYKWAGQEGAEDPNPTILAVPMLREATVIGVLTVQRTEVRPFTDKQIELVTTFADQAVIAIENVRLFQELEARNHDLTEALEQQTATGEILRVISSSPTDVQPVFDAIVKSAVRLCGAFIGDVYRFDGELIHFVAQHNFTPEAQEITRRLFPAPPNRNSATARSILDSAVVHIPDVHGDPEYRTQDWASAAGIRSVLSVPMLRDGTTIGAITVARLEAGPFSDKQIALLQIFADEAVIAIENVRLFREISDKSQQLEAASRHKSEFLANMSHELRTPLNAIIGFSEVLAERMFGEVNAKQAEYLQDILSSGRHLLSLINDILDLSKVEAGRLELELDRFHLPTALDNALTLVRERATRHGITLTQSVDGRVGDIVADERKVKQILLNLLSNAVKFTPEGGRVGLTATVAEGAITIAVSDTGIGIAPEDQAAIFEEFRQVGRDDSRTQEGTGLGLTLAKKFVELHGGRIWVQSHVCQGSTFTFTLPRRV